MPSKKQRAKEKKSQKAAQAQCEQAAPSRWQNHFARSQCLQCHSTTDVFLRCHVHPTQRNIILANAKKNVKYKRVLRRVHRSQLGSAPVCDACMARSYPDDPRPWALRDTHLTETVQI